MRKLKRTLSFFTLFISFSSYAQSVLPVPIPASTKDVPYWLERPTLAHQTKICVIGDAGTGDSSQARVAKALASEGCHHVRYTGDIIYERGLKSVNDPLFQKRFMTPYKGTMDQGIAFYMALGNHDYYGEERVWLELSKLHPSHIIIPNLYYAEMWGDDVCVITLDTNIPSNSGQKVWAQSVLQQFKEKKCQFSMAFAHHPYWSVGSHGDAKSHVKTFLENVVTGKIDLFLAGHDHQLSDETAFLGTRLLISGAGGQLRKVKTPRTGGFAKSQLGYINIVILREAGKPLKVRYDLRGVAADGSASTIYSQEFTPAGIR